MALIGSRAMGSALPRTPALSCRGEVPPDQQHDLAVRCPSAAFGCVCRRCVSACCTPIVNSLERVAHRLDLCAGRKPVEVAGGHQEQTTSREANDFCLGGPGAIANATHTANGQSKSRASMTRPEICVRRPLVTTGSADLSNFICALRCTDNWGRIAGPAFGEAGPVAAASSAIDVMEGLLVTAQRGITACQRASNVASATPVSASIRHPPGMMEGSGCSFHPAARLDAQDAREAMRRLRVHAQLHAGSSFSQGTQRFLCGGQKGVRAQTNSSRNTCRAMSMAREYQITGEL